MENRALLGRLRTAIGRPPRVGGSELSALLVKAGANLVEAAELCSHYFREWPEERKGYRRRIVEIEHRGDEITGRLIVGLHGALAQPFDRADFYRLARAIDDVVDDIEEAMQGTALHQIEAPMEQSQDLADVLRDAARALGRALQELHEGGDVRRSVNEVRHREREADRIYRDALADLFREGVDPMLVLRWKDVLTAIEQAVDRARNAAELVEGLTIKYG